jgi:hypothetical protein
VAALNDEFDREFWSGTSLNELFAAATQNARGTGPMERIFASGMREFQKLRERRVLDTGALLDGARRAMRASYQRELDSIATRRVFGEVAAHALLHEEEAMKVAMVNGLCRYCKETPLSRAPGTHPTLCPSCTPS